MSDIYPKELESCRLCPRLAVYREEVAKEKRRAYKDQSYWGKPVPGFGDLSAKILLLGLAPGAHGSNRTGRMFTGDSSGNFLYPALHRAGFASQPNSVNREDGLSLKDIWITAAARCVPPGNKPSREEVATCKRWLEHDFSVLKNLKLVLALGQIAHDAYLEILKARGSKIIKGNYPFAHGALHEIGDALPMLDAYHVSFQNTNTGKLTAKMFDDVLEKAKLFVV
jgi:uracil-DNA glycosylase family 4